MKLGGILTCIHVQKLVHRNPSEQIAQEQCTACTCLHGSALQTNILQVNK